MYAVAALRMIFAGHFRVLAVTFLMGTSVFENFCGVSVVVLAAIMGPAPQTAIVPQTQCAPQDQHTGQSTQADWAASEDLAATLRSLKAVGAGASVPAPSWSGTAPAAPLRSHRASAEPLARPLEDGGCSMLEAELHGSIRDGTQLLSD